MSGYEGLNELLGKTIKGVVVKKNLTPGGTPAVSIHFVFDDDTSYEIYSLIQMGFASGLNQWDMKRAREYGTGPKEPMENVFEISVDEE